MWKYLLIGLLLSASPCIGLCASEASSARLSFTYSGTGGELSLTNTYDAVPQRSCFLRFRASIYYEGQSSAYSVMNLTSRRGVRSRFQRITLTKLPGVLTRGGKDPVLTIQSKTYCPNRVFVSNAVARFVVCGKGGKSTSPADFLTLLSLKLTAKRFE